MRREHDHGPGEAAPANQATARQWLVRFARFGIGVRGLVWTLSGALALHAAFSVMTAKGARGTLQQVAQQPFGRIALGVIALGLACFAAWRFVEGFANVDREPRTVNGVLTRLGYVVTGITYVVLAWIAAQIAWAGAAAGGSERAAEQAVALRLLAQPAGPWLLGVVGIVLGGVGVSHFYQVVRGSTMDGFARRDMSQRQWRLTQALAAFSWCAFGVVFLIMGVAFAAAALTYDADKARGFAGALHLLEEQAYGPCVLVSMGLAFLAFGAYCFLRARYREIRTR